MCSSAVTAAQLKLGGWASCRCLAYVQVHQHMDPMIICLHLVGAHIIPPVPIIVPAQQTDWGSLIPACCGTKHKGVCPYLLAMVMQL